MHEWIKPELLNLGKIVGIIGLGLLLFLYPANTMSIFFFSLLDNFYLMAMLLRILHR